MYADTDAVHVEQFEGFDIALYAEPEYMDPCDLFEANDPVIEQIRSFQCSWFCARVTASKEGVVLATEYLGGCAYEYASQFVDKEGEQGYFTDMRASVVQQAKEKIAELTKTA